MRKTFRNAKLLQHTNKSPQKVSQSFYITDDVSIAKMLNKHILLSREQLLEFLFMEKVNLGMKRVTKLCKHGFINRYKTLDEQGKTCEHFYTVGPDATEHLNLQEVILPSPDVIGGILATNQFFLSCLLNQGSFDYQLSMKTPVTGYVYARGNVYTVYAPEDDSAAQSTIDHINTTKPSRAIIIAPTRDLAIRIDSHVLIPARYAFDVDIIEHRAAIYGIEKGDIYRSTVTFQREAG